MDRVEKLTIRRSLRHTVVKLVVTEGGITTDYSVKTSELGIPEAIQIARRGCDRFLKLAQEPNVVRGGKVTLMPVRS